MRNKRSLILLLGILMVLLVTACGEKKLKTDATIKKDYKTPPKPYSQCTDEEKAERDAKRADYANIGQDLFYRYKLCKLTVYVKNEVNDQTKIEDINVGNDYGNTEGETYPPLSKLISDDVVAISYVFEGLERDKTICAYSDYDPDLVKMAYYAITNDDYADYYDIRLNKNRPYEKQEEYYFKSRGYDLADESRRTMIENDFEYMKEDSEIILSDIAEFHFYDSNDKEITIADIPITEDIIEETVEETKNYDPLPEIINAGAGDVKLQIDDFIIDLDPYISIREFCSQFPEGYNFSIDFDYLVEKNDWESITIYHGDPEEHNWCVIVSGFNRDQTDEVGNLYFRSIEVNEKYDGSIYGIKGICLAGPVDISQDERFRYENIEQTLIDFGAENYTNRDIDNGLGNNLLLYTNNNNLKYKLEVVGNKGVIDQVWGKRTLIEYPSYYIIFEIDKETKLCKSHMIMNYFRETTSWVYPEDYGFTVNDYRIANWRPESSDLKEDEADDGMDGVENAESDDVVDVKENENN